MFTLDQIKAAHSLVKSGADFPRYVQDLINLGVIYYETFVEDGHTQYYGNGAYQISSPARYSLLTLTDPSNAEQFKADLRAHQEGKTDYPTFCNDCAKSGVYKWEVNTEKMTCTYYDRKNVKLLTEQIPSA